MYTKITHVSMDEYNALRRILFETQCDEPIAAVIEGETERSILCDVRFSDCEHVSFPYRQMTLGGVIYYVFALEPIAAIMAEESRRFYDSDEWQAQIN